jgi:hypothetical protein
VDVLMKKFYTNNLIDFWWDEISPKLTRYNYNAYGLTPEVLKYLCLNNQLICMQINELIIFGMFEYIPDKSFNIVYVEGGDYIGAFKELSDSLRDVKCFKCTGIANPVLASKVHYKGIEKLGFKADINILYEIDLKDYNIEFFNNLEINTLNAGTHYKGLDLILDKTLLNKDYLLQNILQDKLVATQVGNSYFVGHQLVSTAKKIFHICEAIDISKANLDEFMHIIKERNSCRFVSLRSKYPIEFLEDSGVQKSMYFTVTF